MFLLRVFVVSLAWLGCAIGYAKEPSESAPSTQAATPIKASAPKRIQSSALIREKFSLGFGSYYSVGDYGINKDTETYSIPFRASYSRKDWRLSMQMPYLRVRGPASVFAISDGVEVIEKIAEGERKRWGNGDLRVTGQYQFLTSPRKKNGAHLGSTVKFPTASSKADLGTGEFDYSFFAGGFIRSGSWISNGRIGYQIMGDTDETDYNNRWFASLGSYYLFDREWSLGFNARHKHKATGSSEAVRTFSTYINKRMKDGWRVGFSLGTGFTDSSADFFGGFQFTKSFVRKRRVVVEHD